MQQVEPLVKEVSLWLKGPHGSGYNGLIAVVASSGLSVGLPALAQFSMAMNGPTRMLLRSIILCILGVTCTLEGVVLCWPREVLPLLHFQLPEEVMNLLEMLYVPIDEEWQRQALLCVLAFGIILNPFLLLYYLYSFCCVRNSSSRRSSLRRTKSPHNKSPHKQSD